MPDITISIPAGIATSRVLDAIAAVKGYKPATDGTKAQFAKKQIILWAKDIVRSYEGSAAGAAAQRAASAAVDTEIVIT